MDHGLFDGFADDAMHNGIGTSTDIANEHLEAIHTFQERQHDIAMDCMFDHGHALGVTAGANDYAAGIADVSHLPGDRAEQFDRAYQECGVERTIDAGMAFHHVPYIDHPALVGLEVALTPSEANVGEKEYFESQQQFNAGFGQGYHDGGSSMFDRSLEAHFAHDMPAPDGDVHSGNVGARSDLASSIDAAFAPVSTSDHADHSAATFSTSDSGGAASSGSSSTSSGASSSSSGSGSGSGSSASSSSGGSSGGI